MRIPLETLKPVIVGGKTLIVPRLVQIIMVIFLNKNIANLKFIW